jgi:hypothetical protein
MLFRLSLSQPSSTVWACPNRYLLSSKPKHPAAPFLGGTLSGNIRLLHVLPEAVTVSLILVYIACCWFVSDAKLKQSSQMGGMLTSHTDASHPTAF